MNKKTILISFIAAALLMSILLIYGIIRHINISAKSEVKEAQAVAVEPKAAAPVVKSGESESDFLSAAQASEKKGDLVAAKDSYQKLIEKYPASQNVAKAQETVDNINIKLLFSSTLTPDSFIYQVSKGDTLNKIAKKFNTTAELIMKSNNLKDANLKLGKKLKITKNKFSIVVDKSQNILTLKSDQEIFKTYKVSTGKNSCTPVGVFKIMNKIVNPPWYPSSGGMIPSGDPKNVLGTRWMGISKQSYGIHGTTDPDAIGKSVTDGCVRMKNEDVEELYSIVPIGTEVTIVD